MEKITFLVSFYFLVAGLAAKNTTTVEYNIRVKTGNGAGCGTDSSFNLTFIGADGENVTFLLDGEGEKLETSKRDDFIFNGDKVYSIDRMNLQRVQKKGWSADWYIHWLTVEVDDTLYVFRINRWIRNDVVHHYYGTLGMCKDGFKRIQECRKEK
ncbi:uncharacterized protein LOC130655555 [Hydractinia symbiolongicarpus]|uniref:uncharacterized protein LOC130655555 n=1 Tax=Hydractinia symbiolongicarpus TaxID=13093 RepID=UPI00254DE65D|nr:uncharacterized protein LOC130655555 [Hydractinia symbiolongicarpus]